MNQFFKKLEEIMQICRRTFLGALGASLAFSSVLTADESKSVPSVPVWEGPEGAEFLKNIVFDPGPASETLKNWAASHLFPLFSEWYPKLVKILPSPGFLPPQEVKFCFRDGKGVAFTSGNTIVCFTPWFEANRNGESAGAAIHELVHVVQQYSRPEPMWLVEGLTDSIRWFLFEPPNLRPRVDFSRAKVTDSYRTTAAFLDYVIRTYDANLIPRLNHVLRTHTYSETYWELTTQRTIDELWNEFRTESETH